MQQKKFRLGIVGCGKISTNHFNALHELSDHFELVSVCDKNAEQLKSASDKLNIQGFTDIDTMIHANPDLDIITLCTPSGMHAEQTKRIAQFKKHVITEKPMATRWLDGVEMVNACDNANVKLFVVKQNRHQPALQLLKRALTKNRFGRIYLVNFNIFWTRPQSYYNQSKWRGTWEFDGGAFMNQASHYVDLVDWLIGPVQSVQAMMSTLATNIQTEDTGVLNIRWRSGALGSMNVTMLTYPKNLEASLTILGEKGTVKIGGTSANQIDHWEFDHTDEEDSKALELKSPPPLSPHFGHKIYYQNVYDTLCGKTTADTDGRD
ncbi:MAG TPA: Gfo/Idh/MocA family oxidoreductase, partial [Gammaproteobacteria bacterium]|nr:Gfo/Idh/MocA family oxidoreductase [Gammaproteobacteria bacterium]